MEDVSLGTALKGHPSPRAPSGVRCIAAQRLPLPFLPHPAPARLTELFHVQFLSSFCTEIGVSESASGDPAYNRGEKLGSLVRPTWHHTPAWPLTNHVTVHRCLYPTEPTHLTWEHINTALSPARKPQKRQNLERARPRARLTLSRFAEGHPHLLGLARCRRADGKGSL